MNAGTAGTLVICVVTLLAMGWSMNNRENKAGPGPAPDFCPEAGDPAVTRLLKTIRQKFNVSAMAAAVVISDGVKFAGAVG
ncbi:MAG: hypothetical protein ABSF34_11495, partial [Verrucomicrobiota bacterium]